MLFCNAHVPSAGDWSDPWKTDILCTLLFWVTFTINLPTQYNNQWPNECCMICYSWNLHSGVSLVCLLTLFWIAGMASEVHPTWSWRLGPNWERERSHWPTSPTGSRRNWIRSFRYAETRESRAITALYLDYVITVVCDLKSRSFDWVFPQHGICLGTSLGSIVFPRQKDLSPPNYLLIQFD